MSLTNTMKSLSESERPYEKCEQFGASHLTDTELLAVLLRTGSSHGENALDLSRRILVLCRRGWFAWHSPVQQRTSEKDPWNRQSQVHTDSLYLRNLPKTPC